MRIGSECSGETFLRPLRRVAILLPPICPCCAAYPRCAAVGKRLCCGDEPFAAPNWAQQWALNLPFTLNDTRLTATSAYTSASFSDSLILTIAHDKSDLYFPGDTETPFI